MEFAFLGTQTSDGFREWRGRNFVVKDGSVAIAKAPVYVSSGPITEDPPAGWNPVDIDLDECGVLYVLSADGEIYRYDRGRGALHRLACVWRGEDGFRDPRAICVTDQTIYVADGAGGRIHAFSRHLLQRRWVADEPVEDPVRLVNHGRTVYALDGGTETDTSDGFLARIGTGGKREDVVTGLEAPTDVAVDDDGDIYLLDDRGGDPVVRKFGPGGEESTTDGFPLEAFEVSGRSEPFDPECLEAVTEDDRAEVIAAGGPETIGGRTWFHLFRYRPESETFDRLGRFERRCSKLLLDRDPDGEVRGFFAIDEAAGEVYFIEREERIRADERTGGYGAEVWNRLDAGVRGVTWHRVTAGLRVDDPGTQVRLSYYATDEREVADLRTLRRIGPADVDRFRDAGVTGLWELLEFDPDEIAEIVGVSRDRTARWLDQARSDLGEEGDLSEISGIGPVYTERLRESEQGVTRRSELLGLAAEQIADVTGAPPVETEGWLDQARSDLGEEGDLSEIHGLEPTDALRLRESERAVTRRSELLELSAEEVARIVSPSPERTARWLESARERIEEKLDREGIPLGKPNPRDALLESPSGRYLWVRLELVGTEFSTPHVESFRAYFPRQSYLRHLPAIYREDERSAEFLERFLSIFESVFVDIEEEIESVTKFLDPFGVPDEYLSWLGRWLAVETAEGLSERANRTLVDEAPELFKKRGTREGLCAILDIVLDGVDPPPASWRWALAREEETFEDRYVLEYPDLDCIADGSEAEAPFERLLGCPQCFLVLVTPFVDDERMRAIERIVTSEAPAHAIGRAVELRPWLQLTGAPPGGEDPAEAAGGVGGGSYLGVNTGLTKREFVVKRSSLGTDSVLVQREEDGHLELRSKLGTDTVLS